MKNLLCLLLPLFLQCSAYAAESNDSIHVEIKDSLLFINHQFVHHDSTVVFFKHHFGKPNRKKKGKDHSWNEYIYDDLGISITTFPNRVSVSFHYKSIIKEQPKSEFRGQITINQHLIKKQYSLQKLEHLFSTYQFNIIHNTSLNGQFFSFTKNYSDNHLSEITYHFNTH
ncbi:MAG: hypothetical protein AB8B74_15020 [Crocinitomicaceae bacterium]